MSNRSAMASRIGGAEGLATIARAVTADEPNAIFNHPAVRPQVAENPAGALDLTPQIADRRNVVLTGEHGCLGFMCQQPGIYEVHTAVLPAGRGQWRRDFCEAGLRYLFCRTDAYEVLTRVPRPHVLARRAAEDAGLRLEFTMPANSLFRGKVEAVDILGIRIQDWLYRAPGLTEMGDWLHHRFAEEAARLGLGGEAHGEVPDHNRIAGAAAYMAFGGQPHKAVALYNRRIAVGRVRHAGGASALIQLTAIAPVTIRFDLGLLRFGDTDVEVIPE